jgi:hypothetical protein
MDWKKKSQGFIELKQMKEVLINGQLTDID